MLRSLLVPMAVLTSGLVLGCGDDATPPSGPRAEQERPAARVAATARNQGGHYQIRGPAADASFSMVDQSGCVETYAHVFGANQTLKAGPGKPTAILATFEFYEYNFCANEILRHISASTDQAIFQASRQLTEARLQATMTGFDDITSAEVQVEIDVVWTGTGELVSSSDRFRYNTLGLSYSYSFKGTNRLASAAGTLAVGGEDLPIDAASDANLYSVRYGELAIVRTR
jgi:hypothetical protein